MEEQKLIILKALSRNCVLMSQMEPLADAREELSQIINYSLFIFCSIFAEQLFNNFHPLQVILQLIVSLILQLIDQLVT